MRDATEGAVIQRLERLEQENRRLRVKPASSSDSVV